MVLKKRKRSLNLRTEPVVQEKKRVLEKTCLVELESFLGFQLKDLTSFNSFCQLMFRPTDPSGLAVVRVFFGLLMMVDTLEERGLSMAELKWGDPRGCLFPLFNFLKPLPLEWMCLLCFLMWLGAAGMMLGACFRFSCLCFTLPYWYLFLLDKSSWNNHSYLYGLLSVMFLFSNAHHCWSVDGLLGKAPKNGVIPLWNYAILRFQVFVLYFFAGLKKLDQDWLGGYSMSKLAAHSMFDPLKLFMTEEQIDFWMIHVFGFFLDLTVGFWMYFDRTRPSALLFLTVFHVMNSRLFTIGMFPYVCLVTMPLFCYPDWPRKLLKKLLNTPNIDNTFQPPSDCILPMDDPENSVKWYHKLKCVFLLSHVVLQGFLPYSHFLTKGYNNWTNGLYGYSWDMMVHSWDTTLVVVKVVDKRTREELFLDPQAWTLTDRWSKHGDMMYQYAHCLRDNIRQEQPTIRDMSIHIDVWCSLNGRFQQRMFDPRVDLLSSDWSPFAPVSWLMPLLTKLTPWRQKIAEIEEQVYLSSNYTDVIFVADFPGLHLENFIHADLTNVSLSVLDGEVIVEIKNQVNITAYPGDSVDIPTKTFHKVHTVSPTPSCYMYTYTNQTNVNSDVNKDRNKSIKQRQYSLLYETQRRWKNFIQAADLVGNSLFKVIHSILMSKKIKFL